MSKSYLKWAGGKSRMLSDVTLALPSIIDRFIEPFVGAGTVGLNIECNSMLIADSNADLINCHMQVRDNPMELIFELDKLYTLGRGSYYELRATFNAHVLPDLKQAALFIYLNKHGFNGMCRYNKSGEFNVPVGKGSIHYPFDEILNCSDGFAIAKFATLDFEGTMSIVEGSDTVYCDPPYTPVSATLSDINYTGEPFTHSNHIRLAELALQSEAYVVISNHDTPLTRELYRHADEIRFVQVQRSISSKASTRGKVGELLAIYKAK